jgi:hypothetical protein
MFLQTINNSVAFLLLIVNVSAQSMILDRAHGCLRNSEKFFRYFEKTMSDKLSFEKKTMYKRCEVLREDERGKSKTRTFTGKFRKNFIYFSNEVALFNKKKLSLLLLLHTLSNWNI